MIIEATWLVKLILAHMITDFMLQPASWVIERNKYHFRSRKLYLHGLITATVAWFLIGWRFWGVVSVILATHIVIDGWKSYRKDVPVFFIVDQLLHLLVILACWYFSFVDWHSAVTAWDYFSQDFYYWKLITGFTFITVPCGIIIGNFTRRWRDKVMDAAGLGNAGKWIGIWERIIVLILVLLNQYSAIGLLVTAKGIIRFSEKDRQEAKTEYLVIGTLLSIGMAIVTGLAIKVVR